MNGFEPSQDEIILKLSLRMAKDCRNAVLPSVPSCRNISTDSQILPTFIFRCSSRIKTFGLYCLSLREQPHWLSLPARALVHEYQPVIKTFEWRKTYFHPRLSLGGHLHQDALTGLYNKHGYLHRETLLLQEAAENQSTVTCFLFDLNRLKYINDHYGHNEGILRFRSSDMPIQCHPFHRYLRKIQ